MTESEYINRVQACERKLYRVAHTFLFGEADCADAIQEAVVKGWLKRQTLREQAYFDTWLIRILINECRNMQRKNRIRLLSIEECVQIAAPAAEIVENEDLRAALIRLPEKYRVVLVLHHVEGLSLDEMSDMLHLPQTLLKSRLHQARKRLRTLLEGDEDA